MINPTSILYIAIIVGALTLIGTGFNHVKNLGYKEAIVECNTRFDKLSREIRDKLTEVEGSLSNINNDIIDRDQAMSQDITNILNRVRRIPITVPSDGKCVPNPEFIQGFNEAVDRVNKEIKK